MHASVLDRVFEPCFCFNQYFHAAADGFSQSFSDDVIILFSTGFRQLYECRQKWSNDLGKSP
jgi:hypothetical protein